MNLKARAKKLKTDVPAVFLPLKHKQTEIRPHPITRS